MLNLDVERLNYDNNEAIKKLREGEIAAMIVVSGAPQAALAKLKKEDGVHFLALDEQSLPGHDLGPVFDNYLLANLTHDQYPALIEEGASVPTVANRALLVAYNWPQNSPRYGVALKNLALLLKTMNNFAEAESLIRRASTLGRRHKDFDHTDVSRESRPDGLPAALVNRAAEPGMTPSPDSNR
jgi:TRAP-type uncharacterized transport system substrate-binding protein